MENNRTNKTILNTIYGLINKSICIIMPFVSRTVIIYVLGLEYAGMNGLFTSILQVLNLAELGISSAVVYCMYKPIAENDTELLSALLLFMKNIYYKIGIVVLIIGSGIAFFVPLLVKDSVPDGMNIVLLYCIYLLNTVIGYFFYSYKSTLLNAGQKIGTISNINTFIVLFQSVIQIIVLVVFKNYYLFLAVLPVFTLINNYWISYCVKKTYPNIVCKGKLDDTVKADIQSRVKGLFVTRICNTTRNAFDSIFISSFIGLSTVAIYGNYYYIMTAVISVLSVLTTAMTASVGNSMVIESVEKNYADMRKFNFLYNWIVGFFTCCMLISIQPFMVIWMGENFLFSFGIVVLLCFYFYFLNIGSIRAVYHDAAGLWWEARYRAIIEAVLNIFLNIILTRLFGVFGTILGTLISLVLVNYIYGSQIVFKYYFKKISVKEYFIDNSKYFFTTVLGCMLVWKITNAVNIYIDNLYILIICNIVIGFFVFNLFYLLCFCKTQVFRSSIDIVHNIIKKKKGL